MRFVGPAIQFDEVLIVADLHLGFEDRHLGSSGLVTDSEHVIAELERTIHAASETTGITTLVLAGDVIDDFALKHLSRRISITRALIRLASRYELVLIEGNHDSMLRTLRIETPVRMSYRFGSVLVTHGDKPLEEVADRSDLEAVDTIVIGHDHPVLALSDGIRLERFKCFVRIPTVRTRFGPKELIILPSAHPDVLGTDVSARFRSPVIDANHPDAEVIVVGDPPRSFGPVKSLITQE